MACGAVLLIVATITLLRIIQRLEGVDTDKVAAVALGLVVTPEVFFRKIIARSAALMTIQAPFLLMALAAVAAGFAGKHPVATYEIGVVVQRYAFTFVALIALLERHCCILFMRYLCCVSLLLEIHQGASQKRYYEKELFH